MPPDTRLALPDGSSRRVGELLRTGRGLLLAADDATAAAARGHSDRVDIVTGTWSVPGTALDAVLVRPDGYVAWTSPGTVDDLTQALERWFGTARGAL
jgi:hypothetical protein